MKDFLLTEKGDLVFHQEKPPEKIEMKFGISDSPMFLLSFDSENKEKEIKGFHFYFRTQVEKTKSKLKIAEREDAITQAIKIRLKTQVGDIKDRQGIGSILYAYKHENVLTPTLKNRISQAISEAIKDIVPDAEVEVTREKVDHNLTYSGFVAYIYVNGKRLLRFYI